MGKFKLRTAALSLMSFMIVVSGVFSMGTPAQAGYSTDVENVLLVDGDTGKLLYASDIDEVLPPASMTKMMSEYLILEAVNNGEISWDQEVPISDFLHELSGNGSLSNVPLTTTGSYTVEELYESVAIYSANASTMALAELIAGSEGEFVRMMNEKGKEIGMGEVLREAGEEYSITDLQELADRGIGDFQFVNSTGLPNSLLNGQHPEGTEADDDNYMSARATATLAYHLINDYPEVLETAQVPFKTFQPEGASTNMQNWNWMLPGTQYEIVDYEYVDGLKTGFTNAAGYTFTGTAEKDGQRLISVIMGADSELHRFEETQRIMEWGFNNFSSSEVFPEGLTLEGNETIPVTQGEESEVAVSTAEAVNLVVRNGQEDSYTYEVEWDESLLDDEGRLIAPVEAGNAVGTMYVLSEGEDAGYLQGEGEEYTQVPVIANESVERAGWFTLMFRNIGGFFSGVWTSVSDTVTGWL
ncbi:D-alanyl-D-alanine carboxypeptidase family protein [Alteribacter natronophilus]|uniref:D-alanyl-D-alanine carboxypeptidase family protein n=1 Tax=Alteribacter natronophilus TaxID=2583810 RepID=UPI00110F2C63|nr:D-alanyl-D-alanine carboxypeptidase family protein [Alteribacter natronophilus]TMW69906.1 D-alanyl-D-alanine carboxypeptidase [Alteribacter natronophilus]